MLRKRHMPTYRLGITTVKACDMAEHNTRRKYKLHSIVLSFCRASVTRGRSTALHHAAAALLSVVLALFGELALLWRFVVLNELVTFGRSPG